MRFHQVSGKPDRAFVHAKRKTNLSGTVPHLSHLLFVSAQLGFELADFDLDGRSPIVRLFKRFPPTVVKNEASAFEVL